MLTLWSRRMGSRKLRIQSKGAEDVWVGWVITLRIDLSSVHHNHYGVWILKHIMHHPGEVLSLLECRSSVIHSSEQRIRQINRLYLHLPRLVLRKQIHIMILRSPLRRISIILIGSYSKDLHPWSTSRSERLRDLKLGLRMHSKKTRHLTVRRAWFKNHLMIGIMINLVQDPNHSTIQ